LSFGKEFTDAVEQKVIAQQEAERARFVVEKAEQEKMAGIVINFKNVDKSRRGKYGCSASFRSIQEKWTSSS
jgi:hypothetical protein